MLLPQWRSCPLDLWREALEEFITSECRQTRRERDANPNAEDVGGATPCLLHARRAREPSARFDRKMAMAATMLTAPPCSRLKPMTIDSGMPSISAPTAMTVPLFVVCCGADAGLSERLRCFAPYRASTQLPRCKSPRRRGSRSRLTQIRRWRKPRPSARMKAPRSAPPRQTRCRRNHALRNVPPVSDRRADHQRRASDESPETARSQVGITHSGALCAVGRGQVAGVETLRTTPLTQQVQAASKPAARFAHGYRRAQSRKKRSDKQRELGAIRSCTGP